MPVFAFRALAVSGRQERGVVDADSARGAWELLRHRGLYPTELVASTRRTGSRHTGARPAELAAVLRQLATLVDAGVPIADALETVAESTAAGPLRDAVVTARGRVREGVALADAVAPYPAFFPAVSRALIRAAEAAATLPGTLERLAADSERSAALRARVRAACTYPAVLLATTAAVSVFLVVAVVPQVAGLFAETGAPLPWTTRLLLATAAAVHTTWWLLVPVVLGAAHVLRRWLADPTRRASLERLLLVVPVVGRLVLTAATARFLRTLASVLASGLPLETGLRLSADAAGSAHLRTAALATAEGIRRGDALATALARTGVFSPLVVRVAATGEQSGALPTALERAATAADEDVAAALGAATALIEPALVLAVGGVVLTLVLAILVPVLTLQPPGVP